jgi:hypothetical protein
LSAGEEVPVAVEGHGRPERVRTTPERMAVMSASPACRIVWPSVPARSSPASSACSASRFQARAGASFGNVRDRRRWSRRDHT